MAGMAVTDSKVRPALPACAEVSCVPRPEDMAQAIYICPWGFQSGTPTLCCMLPPPCPHRQGYPCPHCEVCCTVWHRGCLAPRGSLPQHHRLRKHFPNPWFSLEHCTPCPGPRAALTFGHGHQQVQHFLRQVGPDGQDLLLQLRVQLLPVCAPCRNKCQGVSRAGALYPMGRTPVMGLTDMLPASVCQGSPAQQLW